jgi:hypothetical protein
LDDHLHTPVWHAFIPRRLSKVTSLRDFFATATA